LITTNPNKEMIVYKELHDIDEVLDVHPLFGEYDIIVKIQSETFNELGRVVVEKIRKIDGVLDTKTLSSIKF